MLCFSIQNASGCAKGNFCKPTGWECPFHLRIMSGLCSNHPRISIGRNNVQILSWSLELAFLRKSRRTGVSSDVGVLLLVCFAWWAQWICHIFVDLLGFTDAFLMAGTRFGELYNYFASVQNLHSPLWSCYVMLLCIRAIAFCVSRSVRVMRISWHAQYFQHIVCLSICIAHWNGVILEGLVKGTSGANSRVTEI